VVARGRDGRVGPASVTWAGPTYTQEVLATAYRVLATGRAGRLNCCNDSSGQTHQALIMGGVGLGQGAHLAADANAGMSFDGPAELSAAPLHLPSTGSQHQAWVQTVCQSTDAPIVAIGTEPRAGGIPPVRTLLGMARLDATGPRVDRNWRHQHDTWHHVVFHDPVADGTS